MVLSKSAEYAVRALVFVAGRDRRVAVRDISEGLGIPNPFLAKLAQALTKAGLLTTRRGPDGGVELARPAEAITLREVVVAIDGTALFERCVIGLPGCGEQKPCPLHGDWVVARGRIETLLATRTLADAAAAVQGGAFRLTPTG